MVMGVPPLVELHREVNIIVNRQSILLDYVFLYAIIIMFMNKKYATFWLVNQICSRKCYQIR